MKNVHLFEKTWLNITGKYFILVDFNNSDMLNTDVQFYFHKNKLYIGFIIQDS